MGDHFVLLVDRLLTESTLNAAIESRNRAHIVPIEEKETGFNHRKTKVGEGGKLVECRICQGEDEDTNMETPCSCCGSLKYAHRDCVQRWCNEKGDTICEICLQQFKPGYTAPPKLFQYGRIPMNFRGNWEISQQDLHDHRFLTMVPTDHNFIGTDYDDYSTSNTRSISYCRSVAITFTLLLVLRHALPIIITGAEHYSFTLFTLLLLRTVGIIVPLYIMLRAITTFHRRRNQQETHGSPTSASEAEDMRSRSVANNAASTITHPYPLVNSTRSSSVVAIISPQCL